MKFPLLLIIVALVLQSCSYLPEESVPASTRVVDHPDYAIYYSGGSAPSNAFLMIPGGFVDALVYECWIDELVKEDPTIAIVVVKFASNLAITNQSKVLGLVDELDQFDKWVIGGHSLGGVVAAFLAADNPDRFLGIVHLASWSTSGSDLSGWEGSVLSIFGSEDGLSSVDEIFENEQYLPPGLEIDLPEDAAGAANTSYYYEISGGNHSGFGCYGEQSGDGIATITQAEQQEQLIEVLSSFLSALW